MPFGRRSPLETLALPGVMLAYKYSQFRQRRREAASRRVTERELSALHHKIVSAPIFFVAFFFIQHFTLFARPFLLRANILASTHYCQRIGKTIEHSIEAWQKSEFNWTFPHRENEKNGLFRREIGLFGEGNEFFSEFSKEKV